MKDNIITYIYKGIALTFYTLFGKKDKIAELYKEETSAVNTTNQNMINKLDPNAALHQEMIDMPKIPFRYKAKDKKGKVIESTFDAYNLEQAKKFLEAEGLEIISIKARGKMDVDIVIGNAFTTADLSFALTQLATYIRAGIPLVDSFRILAKQTANLSKRKIYEMVIYDLLAGDSLSDSFAKQKKAFPRLLVNMVKASELTGDLPATLDDMAEYYTSIDKTKKEIKSALTYPVIILFFSIAVIAFVLIYIIPQYQSMFDGYGIELPKITQIILGLSGYLQENWVFVLSIIAFVLLAYLYLFKNVKSFRKTMQTIALRFPVLKNILMYSEISMFTKTFASLLNHGVFITDSMEVLMNVSENEVYKEIMENTVKNLNCGGKISESFKDNWAIPLVAYEMIVTGENTGQLGTMMEKVYKYYDNLHTNAVTSLKTLMEPILIVFLAFTVGIIIISIILPMFEMYGALT